MRRDGLAALLLLLPFAPAEADDRPSPRFAPVAVPAHAYTGGWEHFVGGGVAVLDCDGDDLPDLFAAGGDSPAVLLRNHGDMRFEAATPAALALTGVTGAYPLDIDGDGYADLAVLRVGENQLLKGGPDCSFSPFADLGFVSDDRWTTAFSATWEAGQSLPTLAFGNYVDRTNPAGPFEACDVNLLYRPEGRNYPSPLPLTPGFCPLSMLFTDWNRGGRADLRISNDRQYYVRGGQEQLWAMEPVPRLYTEAEGWARFNLWGMGIASRDVNGDGLPDVYLTSMADQRLQLRQPGPGPTYADVPYELGSTAHRPYEGDDGRPSTGWHVQFGDVQNDGIDDVFIAKGNVDQMPGNAIDDPNSLLIGQPDGRYAEAGDVAGVDSMARARGAALVDLDRDGRLDLVVVNRRAPLQIWRNVTEGTGHWVGIRLRQPGGNRDAIGAWIELRTAQGIRAREVTVGGGHAGGQLVPEHFGLGGAGAAEARVTWPDGVQSDWVALPTGRYLMLERDAAGQAVIR